jgi:trimethylamine:corrinoid methyltransferase-like protein
MQPKLELLPQNLVERILDEALQLLLSPGIKVKAPAARRLLAEGGAQIDEADEVVHFPETIVRRALETAPTEFFLYNPAGEPVVRYDSICLRR